MQLFSEKDRRLIEESVLDPSLEPGYELVRGCLVWADETPDAISVEGRRFIHDLQAARSLLYHRISPAIPTSPEVQHFYATLLPKYRTIWEQATSISLRWPGFHPTRIELSDALVESYRRIMDEPL